MNALHSNLLSYYEALERASNAPISVCVATAVGWLAVLVVNVALALTWAYLFYVPHALTGAAVGSGWCVKHAVPRGQPDDGTPCHRPTRR